MNKGHQTIIVCEQKLSDNGCLRIKAIRLVIFVNKGYQEMVVLCVNRSYQAMVVFVNKGVTRDVFQSKC